MMMLTCDDLVSDFSNVLTKSQIEEMASVDEFEVVKEVQVSCFRSFTHSGGRGRQTSI